MGNNCAVYALQPWKLQPRPYLIKSSLALWAAQDLAKNIQRCGLPTFVQEIIFRSDSDIEIRDAFKREGATQ